MREIKTNTDANVMIWMADSTDHITGKTGLTLTITLSKDGGAFAAATPTVTERGNGWYNVALTNAASHTNTLGELVVRATATGADPGEKTVVIVEHTAAEVYNAIMDPGAELSSVPGATGSLHDKMIAAFQYCYHKREVNKTTLTHTIYKVNDSSVFGSGSVADDGTVWTKGRMS